MNVIEVKNLTKSYGKRQAITGVNISIAPGKIVGLIGPNGSGKTTTLKALLGLIPSEGHLQVLGKDPRTQRNAMLEEVCFIADVAVLPRWMTVKQAVDFTKGVHPRFNRAKAESYIARTQLTPGLKVRQMSKGMVVQLHLALIMAIDAKVLVLDEPTLGLDLLYRKQFYQSLIEEYFDDEKTILITTHQVEEIEHLLTDILFINDGKICLDMPMDRVREHFSALQAKPENVDAARGLGPMQERKLLGNSAFVYAGADREKLATLGLVSTPSLSDIFMGFMQEKQQ